MVESIITRRLSLSSGKTLNISSQIPDRAQRVKRLWTLFQLPYSTGRPFHCAPLRSTQRTPFTKLRLSLAVTPTWPGRPGRKPSICRHWDALSWH
jgi:hypothetical protein